jgi:hypothetical protein
LLQWNAYTGFRSHTEDRFTDIEAMLRANRAAQYPKKVFNEIISLDKKDFTRNLPALRTVAEQPIWKVAATGSDLHQIFKRLTDTNDSTPEYWPTVLQFLQFASSGLGSKAPPSGPSSIIASNSVFINAKQAFPSDSIILLDGGSLQNTELLRDRIIFTNNPLKIRNVRFVDCAFELPVLSDPNPYLRQVARQLLASNLGNIESLGR